MTSCGATAATMPGSRARRRGSWRRETAEAACRKESAAEHSTKRDAMPHRAWRSAHKEALPKNLTKTGRWLRCRRLASTKDAGVPAPCHQPVFCDFSVLEQFCCLRSKTKASLGLLRFCYAGFPRGRGSRRLIAAPEQARRGRKEKPCKAGPRRSDGCAARRAAPAAGSSRDPPPAGRPGQRRKSRPNRTTGNLWRKAAGRRRRTARQNALPGWSRRCWTPGAGWRPLRRGSARSWSATR